MTGRRLIETESTGRVSVAEPSDVAYGNDKMMYEVFAVGATYFEAGATCSARGGQLASYASESSQVFVDVLCDAAAGMKCWVEGNNGGRCASIDAGHLTMRVCSKRQPFVCSKSTEA